MASFGCGNDDEMTAPATVAGTWTVEKYDLVSVITVEDESNTINSVITGKNNTELLLTFNESPNTYTFEGEAEITSTTTDANGVTTTAVEDADTDDNGTWVRDGDELILTDGEGESSSITIVELTSSVLRGDAEDEFTVDLFGVEVDYQISGEIVLRR